MIYERDNGGREFYTYIGFETICNRELLKKEWKNRYEYKN